MDEIYEISEWKLVVPKSGIETEEINRSRVRKCRWEKQCAVSLLGSPKPYESIRKGERVD